METVFLQLLNMSITASWLVAAIIILRLLLKKVSKKIIAAMWILVGIRLLCPFSFDSVLSLIPSTETIPTDIIYSETPGIQSGIPIVNETVNPIISEVFTPAAENGENPMLSVVSIVSAIWLVGMILMLFYAVISYLNLRKKLKEATPKEGNIWICDRIGSPFVLGIFKPRIYLPSYISNEDEKYVILHEKAHISRFDHWRKPVGFLLLSVYWFNPVLWIAYILLCRDIEFACDEKVIKESGAEIKKPYSEALINCSIPKSRITACPVAFGEVGVKGRIKSVLNYKKPAFWIYLTAILLCIAVAIGFATNPKKNKLTDVEDISLTETINNADHIMVGNGETYTSVSVSKELLSKLEKIEISAAPVSQNRGDSRDKTNTLIFRSDSDIETSNLKGTYLHFSKDFSQVWVNNGTKPTLSYRIENPISAKQIFTEISNNKNESDFPVIDVTVFYVNNYEESDIFMSSLNPDKLLVSSVQHLPIFKFENIDDIRQFKNRFTGKLIFSKVGDDLRSFNESMAKYDKTFFKENALLAVYVPSRSGSFRYGLSNIYNDGKNLFVDIEQINDPLFRTDDMSGWIITAAIKKTDIKDVVSYDAALLSSGMNESDEFGLKMDAEFKSPTEFDIIFNRTSETKNMHKYKVTVSPEYMIRVIVKTSFGNESVSFEDYIGIPEKVFSWDSVVYEINPNKPLILHENLSDTYGELPPGEYLLVKDVLFSDGTNEFSKVYSVCFTVSKDGITTYK